MPMAKTIPTIAQSAELARNTGMGGHILQHIHGEANPPASQMGKTLFKTRKAFENIWNCFLWYGPDQDCRGSAKLARIGIGQLKLRFVDAYSCTGVDANGACNGYESYMAENICFGFKTVGGQWILNTCYPEPLDFHNG